MEQHVTRLHFADQPVVPIVIRIEIRLILRDRLITSRMVLLSSTRTDFATGEKLDYLSQDKDRRVQLHHIFPKRWCSDNKGSHEYFNLNPEIVNCFANLIPLAAASNNAWMTRSPATAIKHFNLAYDDHDPRFGNAFIDQEMFDLLLQETPDPQRFWELRAERIADRLHSLQYVAK